MNVALINSILKVLFKRPSYLQPSKRYIGKNKTFIQINNVFIHPCPDRRWLKDGEVFFPPMILSSHWEVWLSQQPQTPKLTDPNSKGIFVFLSITSGWESSNNHKRAGHFTGQNESSGAHLKFTNKIQPQFNMGFTLSPHTRFSVFPIFFCSNLWLWGARTEYLPPLR